MRHIILVVDGKGFAPIALSRKDGVTQTVIHLSITDAFLLQLVDDRLHGLFVFHPGQKPRLYQNGIFTGVGLF